MDIPQLLDAVRRQDAAGGAVGEPIIITSRTGADGLSSVGMSVTFVIPSGTVAPSGTTIAQISAGLQLVADYCNATVQDTISVKYQVMFQSYSTTVFATTTVRSKFFNIPVVVGQLRTDADGDDGSSLPNIATSLIMPVRYTGSSTSISNEDRIFMTASNSRVSGDGEGVPGQIYDAVMSFNLNQLWDAVASDGITATRYSLQDYALREVVQAMGWLSGTDFLSRDITAFDLYRHQSMFVSGTGQIQTPSSYDYNPGNGLVANNLFNQVGGLNFPLVDPTDANGDGIRYWTPKTLAQSDANGNGYIEVGEGDSSDTIFPRMVCKNSPNDRQFMQLVANADGAPSDFEIIMNDGSPIKAHLTLQHTTVPMNQRHLLGSSIPKGVTWYSRSTVPADPLGVLPDYLTKTELRILDSIGYTIDVQGTDETVD
ncbi:MAG: hypothetical protein EXS00_06820 [Phycisphaerales bacterium]|nr:hypothetical protein [Phycisphaerales bacterium]